MTEDRLFRTAVVHHQAGRLAEAVRAYRDVLAHAPRRADVRANLGAALSALGRHEAACEQLRKAVALAPSDYSARNNLGRVLEHLGELDEAARQLERAVAAEPTNPVGLRNYAENLTRRGFPDKALTWLDRALAQAPNDLDTLRSRIHARLLSGDLVTGFREFNTLRARENPELYGRCDRPLWDGRSNPGARLLLHESAGFGFGDCLQLIRYAPLAAARVGSVRVECRPELCTVLRTVDGIGRVVPRGAEPPACDLHLPVSALPTRFGTTLTDIPSDVPYLRAPAGGAAGIGPRRNGRYRAGIVWAGKPGPDRPQDPSRSLSLRELAPLLDLPEVEFFSLQKGEAARELDATQPLVDLDAQLTDFGATARAIEALDLVISVDTSVAHLAGAMGRPVWVLLPYAPDWRWLLGRADSPWYPTMRLFRQPAPGDWAAVVLRVREALHERAAASIEHPAAG